MSVEQLPPSSGYPGQQAPPPPPQGTSGLAIAGLITAFLAPPIGFILSLIAIFKTGNGRRKGRGLAVTGLIVSALAIAVMVAVFVLVFKAVSDSTVADPGCVKGKQVILDAAAGKADPSNLQKAIDGLNAAAASAKHDSVRDAMKLVADDYTQIANGAKTGELPDGIMEKLQKDADNIDKLCTLGG